jgi:hypothetical protein
MNHPFEQFPELGFVGVIVRQPKLCHNRNTGTSDVENIRMM